MFEFKRDAPEHVVCNHAEGVDYCIWYQHNPDNVGRDLGVGDGVSNGADFARVHAPMKSWDLPCSDGRGDFFALGFFDGVRSVWGTLETV